MKRVMLVGAVGAGKTSLMHALQDDGRQAGKTSSICFYDGAIDTPGEYAQVPRFYSALLVTAVEADLVVMVHDATQAASALPPGFAGMFSRPVIGVATKIDLPSASRERAAACLQQTGVAGPLFYVSAASREGIDELAAYLSEGGCEHE